MKWKNLTMFIATSLSIMLLLANCGDPPKEPSSSATYSTIKLVVGNSTCSFPPSGGYNCEIEILGYNASQSAATKWRLYSKSNVDFSGNPPSISVEVPSSGQFQINITLQAKDCQHNCCNKCTVSGWGRPVYKGNSGMVDRRATYEIKIDQVACRCC